MRHKLTLQTMVETADPLGTGQLVQTWPDTASFFGFLRPLGGRELVNSGQTKAESDFLFTTRWQASLATVDPKQRFIFEGRTFHIVNVNNIDERKKQLDIYLKEMVGPTS